MERIVVVGIDGGGGEGTAALDWAADDALSRGARLFVVSAYHHVPSGNAWEAPADRRITGELRLAAEAAVRRAVAHVQQRSPALEVDGAAVDDHPSRALVRLSASAEVTVVGTRHLGRAEGALLGSVSSRLVAAGRGPVVVLVAPPGDPATHPPVVVGVDGSDAAAQALAFAFDVASRRGRPLHAVLATHPDVLADMQWRGRHEAPERARLWLSEQLAGWQEKYPDVAIHEGAVRQHPVAALAEASAGSELLVVGADGLRSRVPGSVDQGVLHHAHCPVAVVHRRTTPAP